MPKERTINIPDWVNKELIIYIEDLGYIRDGDFEEDHTIETVVKFEKTEESKKSLASLFLIYSDDFVCVFANNALYHDYDDQTHYILDYDTFEEFQKVIMAEVDRKTDDKDEPEEEPEEEVGVLTEDNPEDTESEEEPQELPLEAEPTADVPDYNDEEVIAEPIPKIASIEVEVPKKSVNPFEDKITKIIEIMGGNISERIDLPLGLVYMNIESSRHKHKIIIMLGKYYCYIVNDRPVNTNPTIFGLDDSLEQVVVNFLFGEGYSMVDEGESEYQDNMAVLTFEGFKRIKDKNVYNSIMENNKGKRVFFGKR